MKVDSNRTEAEFKWQLSQLADKSNLTMMQQKVSNSNLTMQPAGSMRSSPAAPHSARTVRMRMLSGLGGKCSSAGSLGFVSNDEFAFPAANARVPQFKRLQPVKPRCAKLKPDQQNFLELTHGVPLQERVRWIAAAEHRGIMVKQLESLVDFIMKRTNPSTGVIQGWVDSHTGEQLSQSTLSLEQVVAWIVEPMTKPVKCSYVEAVAMVEESQKPTWFVSYWIGTPFFELVNCTKKHAQTRSNHRYPAVCSVTGAYWTCAFAMNQHTTASNDLSGYVNEQPFYKAMFSCRGILLVLDSLGPATAFRRLWCCFELVVAVQAINFEYPPRPRNNLVLDIASCDSQSEPQILTDGLTDTEAAKSSPAETDIPVVGYSLKNEREGHFPIDRLRDGLKIDVKDPKMSSDLSAADRMSIMKALAGHDGQARFQVFADNPTYDEVSRKLRAKLGNLALRQLIRQGKGSGQFGDELSKAITDKSDNDTFDMNLMLCEINSKSDDLISKCIPQNGSVRKANFNFGHCYKMSSVQATLDAISSMENLQDLSVNFESCVGLESVEELNDFAAALARVGGLRSVIMNFEGCDKIGPLDDFVRELKRAKISSLQIIAPDGSDASEEQEVTQEKPQSKKKAKGPQKWVSETAKLWTRRGSRG
jgi:hypothetical protein